MGFSLGPLDSIPGVGLIDGSQAAKQKAGFDQLNAQNQAGTQALQDFFAKQGQKAEAYYKPLQAMFTSAYGNQGLEAPTYPGSTNPATPAAAPGAQAPSPQTLQAMFQANGCNAALMPGPHGGK
jgi:hypothetical protein